MTESADILIIGGGVMGASIAYNLAKQGAGRVVLVERQALGNGTTGRSGAIVRQHYSNDFTIRMALESLAVFQHFADLVGGDCGFVTTGMVVLADEAGKEALRVNVQLQQEQGINVQLIDGKTVPEVASGYSNEDIAVACYERDAGVADPMATTYWPIKSLEERTWMRLLSSCERLFLWKRAKREYRGVGLRTSTERKRRLKKAEKQRNDLT